MKKRDQGGVMIGKILLHYKMLEKLGEGGMGVVYKAEDTRLKRLVAVKFLPHEIAGKQEMRQRFEVEAQAAATLNHPNIATIYTIEEADGVLFIVMEYVRGRQLKEVIRENSGQPLSMDQIAGYGLQIAEGLQSAHENGVIHRDVKSGNILLTNAGRAVILDFGLAKVRNGIHAIDDDNITGTLAYMSPEQIRGEEVDHRTDVWALGVVLFEMLTTRLPFTGRYAQEIQFSILNEDVESLAHITSKKLIDIIRKTLEKDVRARYQTMQAVVLDLLYVHLESRPETSGLNRITSINMGYERDGGFPSDPAAEPLIKSRSNGSRPKRAWYLPYYSSLNRARLREISGPFDLNLHKGTPGKLSRLLRLILQLVNVWLAAVYKTFDSQ